MSTFAKKPKRAPQTPESKASVHGRSHDEQTPEAGWMLRLQGTVGNHAAQQLLGEKPGGLRPGGPLRLASRQPAPGSLLFRQPTGTKQAPEMFGPKTPYSLSEEVWKSLLAFSARATPELLKVGKRMTAYLERYDAAYVTFTQILKQAEEEAASSDKWAGVMMGIAIGTGVGLAAGALYTATSMVGKIVYEAGGEGVEAVAGGVLGGSSNPDFKPPDDLNNDKVARGYYEKIYKAWEAVGVMQAATLAYSPRRDALKAEAASGAGKTAPDAIIAELERLKAALAAADGALTLFLSTADVPLLGRDQATIEQDIWIAWMGRAKANGSAALGDNPIGRHMNELRIWGRLAPEGGELNEASKLAQEEGARMQQIGRVGVVIVPPTYYASQRNPAKLGVIRFRHDGYAAAGRVDPTPAGAEEYVKINWAPQRYIRPGEVVLVSSTTVPALNVQELGPNLPVTKDERAAAFKLLGITEAEYRPEMGEALSGFVWNAEQDVYQEENYKYSTTDRPPHLQKTLSEDGVLLSDASGKKLILFTVNDAGDLLSAMIRRERVGAPVVVAINLNPDVKIEEFRSASAVLTNHSDASFLAKEIRAVRNKEEQPAKP